MSLRSLWIGAFVLFGCAAQVDDEPNEPLHENVGSTAAALTQMVALHAPGPNNTGSVYAMTITLELGGAQNEAATIRYNAPNAFLSQRSAHIQVMCILIGGNLSNPAIARNKDYGSEQIWAGTTRLPGLFCPEGYTIWYADATVYVNTP